MINAGFETNTETQQTVRTDAMRKKLMKLQKGIVYGPVNSRRLGRSLGINVLPTQAKVCSFNCLYCQYGFTKAQGVRLLDSVQFPAVSHILNAVETKLVEMENPPDYLTFSGHGEATLHPHFDELVDGITELRDKYAPDAKTAILSNASTVSDARIRRILSRLDEAILKLDAGSESVFQRYNQPVIPLHISEIVEGLRMMDRVILQSLFADGERGNLKLKHIIRWLRQVEAIQPEKVQLYTLDRAYPSRLIVPAAREHMAEIAEQLGKMGITALVY